MRIFALLALPLALAACGSQSTAPTNDAADLAKVAAPTPEALAAKAQVARYFELIAAKAYKPALAMWAADSASRITPADLAREYGRYRRYAVTPGDPTAITTQGDTAYVIVAATARFEPAAGGPAQSRSGQVYLKRPVKGEGAWQIWGVDIRRRD